MIERLATDPRVRERQGARDVAKSARNDRMQAAKERVLGKREKKKKKAEAKTVAEATQKRYNRVVDMSRTIPATATTTDTYGTTSTNGKGGRRVPVLGLGGSTGGKISLSHIRGDSGSRGGGDDGGGERGVWSMEVTLVGFWEE